MKKFDRFVSIAVLGLIAPVALALAAWWSGYLLLKDADSAIPYLIPSSFAAGIALDLTVLRKFLPGLFLMPLPALLIVEAFYSIIAFGIFMGLPVFCSLAGVAASYVIIRKAVYRRQSKEGMMRNARTANAFSFTLLLTLCVCSALLALTEPSICSQIKMMLGLNFTVEMWMIWLLIIFGGAMLLAFQYSISRLIIKAGMKRL